MMDLRRHGLTQVAVANLTEINLSSVKHYALLGETPSYDNGLRLVQLWCQVTGRPVADAPQQRAG